jgi:ABC-type transporter Mla subunit MlaD
MAKPRRLYVRVGILILAGLLLGIGFVLFLTAGRLGKSAEIFETYLGESVTGLEPGAPVRYRGVRIGQLTEIGLVNAVYPPDNRQNAAVAYQLVLVRFAIDPERASMPNLQAVQQAVDHGLRARLSSQGLTGVSYIELDFVDPERFPIRQLPWKPVYAVIPSVPSTVAQVQNAAEDILSRIEKAPIEQILADISAITGSLRGQPNGDGDLARTLHEAAETMAALRQAVVGSDVAGTMDQLRSVATNLNTLTSGPEAKQALTSIAAAAAEMRTAISRLPAAINSLEQTARAARGVTQDTNADLSPILRDLRAVASNLRDTTELLRRSPGQAIFGAPPPPNR